MVGADATEGLAGRIVHQEDANRPCIVVVIAYAPTCNRHAIVVWSQLWDVSQDVVSHSVVRSHTPFRLVVQACEAIERSSDSTT